MKSEFISYPKSGRHLTHTRVRIAMHRLGYKNPSIEDAFSICSFSHLGYAQMLRIDKQRCDPAKRYKYACVMLRDIDDHLKSLYRFLSGRDLINCPYGIYANSPVGRERILRFRKDVDETVKLYGNDITVINYEDRALLSSVDWMDHIFEKPLSVADKEYILYWSKRENLKSAETELPFLKDVIDGRRGNVVFERHHIDTYFNKDKLIKTPW